MKKSIKLVSLFIISIVAMIIGKEVVMAADNSPATYTATTYQLNTKPLGLTIPINVKKTSNGKYVYCLEVAKKLPVSSITYTKNKLYTDPIINYIVTSGYSDKNDNEFFATQAALWIHLLDSNQMTDTSTGYAKKIKTAVYSSTNANDPIAIDVKNILASAKQATKVNKNVTFEIASKDVKFTLKNGQYVSDYIKVNTNIANKDYSIFLYNQPEGTELKQDSNGFTITIPEKNVKVGTVTIGAVLHHQTTFYNVYKYTPSNSNYQNMLAVYPEIISVSDEISIPLTREAEPEEPEEPEDPTTIIISKQDITNKEELPGATLIVRDSDGDIIDKWVSTNKPHTLENLKPGKYTLEEITAPDGYTLNSEKITFRVREDGKVKTVVMYNTPEEVEEIVISISKQDITTKEELPGATLIIRNSEGKELYRWVSGNEPYVIKGIEEGTYTLEEIIAPDGYQLSSEKITFEVKNNGVVTEVVMYNTPVPTEVVIVPPTGAFASLIKYIAGGLVIIAGSVLIYKNVKKEQ